MALTIQQKRERRAQLMRETRELVDTVKGSEWTDEHQKTYDKNLAEIEQIDRDVKLEQAELDELAAERFHGRVETPAGWFNPVTNEPVRVLAPGERFARSQPADRQGVCAGDVIVAKVTGNGSDAVRAELSEGVDSDGGYSVPRRLADEFIDQLRAQTRVIQAGARTVDMDADNLRIVKIAGDPTPMWRSENAAITESQPTFDAIDFRARWLGVLVKGSRELFMDSPNAGEMVQQSLVGAMAVEMDRAAMFGSGAAPEPTGLVSVPGIHVVDLGTDGAPLASYQPLLQAASLVTGSNAGRPSAWIMSPRTLYESIGGLTASDGQPLMAPQVLQPLNFLETASVPNDETHGSANNASRILAGDWPRFMVGMRSQLRVESSQHLFLQNFQTAILAWLRVDFAATHAEAFASVEGILPPTEA